LCFDLSWSYWFSRFSLLYQLLSLQNNSVSNPRLAKAKWNSWNWRKYPKKNEVKWEARLTESHSFRDGGDNWKQYQKRINVLIFCILY
jgi:hypothetical protein